MFNRTTREKPITLACCALAGMALCADLSFAQSGGGSGSGASSGSAGGSSSSGGAAGSSQTGPGAPGRMDPGPAPGGNDHANPASPSAPAPQSDPRSRGSGGPASTGAGSGEAGNLDASTVRSPNSISDEPNRLKRGGGASGKALEACMADWDTGTHMTKEQWRTTCERLGR